MIEIESINVYTPDKILEFKIGDQHPEAHMKDFLIDKLEVFNNGTFCGATIHFLNEDKKLKRKERVIIDMVGFPVRTTSFIEKVKKGKTVEDPEEFEKVESVKERKEK